MIQNTENVARAIFSPKMIYNGELLPAAFELRPRIKESYISVMRTSIESWLSDIQKIPQNKNRTLYGYAEMNVAEIRQISLTDTSFDVIECSNETVKSHAGIFITYKGIPVVGGEELYALPAGVPESAIRLAIRNELLTVAQKGLKQVPTTKI